MRHSAINSKASVWLLALMMATPSIIRAGLEVYPGWDLLVTVPGSTEFLGQNWQGVPFGLYDFGAQGVRAVGPADTIIRRPQAAIVSTYGQSATVPMSIAALQLQSVNAFDPDGAGPAPTGLYFITLGGASTGNVTINFDHEPGTPPHGWFSTDFTINYEMHYGALNGPVVGAGIQGFDLSTGYWAHDKVSPDGGVPLLAGVNYLLDGVDTLGDFHLAFGPNGEGVPSAQEQGAGAPPPCYPPGDPIFTSPRYIHLVKEGYDPAKHGITECPEPSSGVLLILALSIVGILRKGVSPAVETRNINVNA